MVQVDSGHRREGAGCPGGHNHNVRFEGGDQVPVGVGPTTHFHPGLSQGGLEPANQVTVGWGGQGREPGRATQPGRPFHQTHPVAASGRHPGTLHAGWSSAYHHHTAYRRGRSRGWLVVVAEPTVDRAHWLTAPEVAGHADEAVDAGTHQFGSAVGQAPRQVRVGEKLASHCHEVASAVGDQALPGGRIEPAHRDDRHVHSSADGTGIVGVLADLPGQRPIGEAHPGAIRGGGRHVNGVGSGCHGQLGRGSRVLRRNTALDAILPPIKPDHDGEARSGASPHGSHHIAEQSGSGFRRTTPPVGAPVPGRGKERGDQIPVGRVDLHAVHPGLSDPSGGLGERLDHRSEFVIAGLPVLGHSATGQGGHPHQLLTGGIDHHPPRG